MIISYLECGMWKVECRTDFATQNPSLRGVEYSETTASPPLPAPARPCAPAGVGRRGQAGMRREAV